MNIEPAWRGRFNDDIAELCAAFARRGVELQEPPKDASSILESLVAERLRVPLILKYWFDAVGPPQATNGPGLFGLAPLSATSALELRVALQPNDNYPPTSYVARHFLPILRSADGSEVVIYLPPEHDGSPIEDSATFFRYNFELRLDPVHPLLLGAISALVQADKNSYFLKKLQPRLLR